MTHCSFRRTLIRNALLTSAALALPGRPLLAAARRSTVDARLRELGITLPELAPAVASYVPWVRSGNQVHISGQLPFDEGNLLFPGTVPDQVSMTQAVTAARQCAINILAALNEACDGDLERVRQCVSLQGYVASADGFNQQSAVINGASDLMTAVFGDAGRHTRVAVGVNSLPLNASVEIAAVFEIASA